MSTYNELDVKYQTMIKEVKILIGDTDDDSPYLDDDTYAVLLSVAVVDDINLVSPTTYFSLNTMNSKSGALLRLGLRVLAYGTLIDKYVEQPDFVQAQVVYADTRDYMDRWKREFDTWAPIYLKAKKGMKTKSLMPGIRVSVGEDYSGVAGVRPSWPSARRRSG